MTADLGQALADLVEAREELDAATAALRALLAEVVTPVEDRRPPETVAYHASMQTLRAVREADAGNSTAVASMSPDGYVWTATHLADGHDDPLPWFGSAFTARGFCLWSAWAPTAAEVMGLAEAAIAAARADGEPES